MLPWCFFGTTPHWWTMPKWLEINKDQPLFTAPFTYLFTYKENITFWFWWAKVQNSYIYYLLHQDERDITPITTQGSINATKLILVKKYIYSMFSSCPFMLSFSHFLLLFAPMYYNNFHHRNRMYRPTIKSLLTWPVSLFTHAHKAT